MTTVTPRPHTFLGGRVQIVENETGHRAGTDAVLLAATAPHNFSGHMVDAGTGTGVVGLIVAARCPSATVTMIEIDPESAALARHNIGLNGANARVRLVETDLLGPLAVRHADGVPDRTADLVLTNPPFFPQGRVRTSPDARRATAHVLSDADLARWMTSVHAMLNPRGRFVMIHRPESLSAIMSACPGKFGGLAVLPVHPKSDAAATRILVSGTKGSRAPLVILPGLVLHKADGSFTEEADAIAKGQALISPALYPSPAGEGGPPKAVGGDFRRG